MPVDLRSLLAHPGAHAGERTLELMVRQAARAGDTDSLIDLASTVPLTGRAADGIRDCADARVRAAWLSRPDLPGDESARLLAAEHRPVILAALGIAGASDDLAAGPGIDWALAPDYARRLADALGSGVDADITAALNAVGSRVSQCGARRGAPVYAQCSAAVLAVSAPQDPRLLLRLLAHRTCDPAARFILDHVAEHISPGLAVACLEAGVEAGLDRDVRWIRGWLSRAFDSDENLRHLLATGQVRLSPAARGHLIEHAPDLAPADWHFDRARDHASSDAALLAHLPVDPDTTERWDEVLDAVFRAHPTLGQPAPCADTAAWIDQLAAAWTGPAWPQRLLTAVTASCLEPAIECAYSGGVDVARTALAAVAAQQPAWTPAEAERWWHRLAECLESGDVDSCVVDACQHLALDPRFRWDLLRDNRMYWAWFLPAAQLDHWPADLVLAGADDDDVAGAVAASIETLLREAGEEALATFLALVESFPGTWGQAIRAARHATGHTSADAAQD